MEVRRQIDGHDQGSGYYTRQWQAPGGPANPHQALSYFQVTLN